ncbi:MAG: response regulator, partial [Candidatus Aminicenantales bacterium]
KSGSDHKILIIDDDIISQNLLRSTLSGAGYSVIAASDGDEGIEKALEHLPGLIILDIMMPGKDGGEVARLLKDNPKTAGIPLIFLSSLITEKDKRIGGKYDILSLLSKPFNRDELLNEVRKYFFDEKWRSNRT